jgi:hypothetical protein
MARISNETLATSMAAMHPSVLSSMCRAPVPSCLNSLSLPGLTQIRRIYPRYLPTDCLTLSVPVTPRTRWIAERQTKLWLLRYWCARPATSNVAHKQSTTTVRRKR